MLVINMCLLAVRASTEHEIDYEGDDFEDDYFYGEEDEDDDDDDYTELGEDSAMEKFARDALRSMKRTSSSKKSSSSKSSSSKKSSSSSKKKSSSYTVLTNKYQQCFSGP